MIRIDVAPLPADPLEAAAAFHREWLADVEERLATGEDVLILVRPADYAHREWRLAAVTGLARKHTPARVNIVAGEGGKAVDATERYLAHAPGVTGQYLET